MTRDAASGTLAAPGEQARTGHAPYHLEAVLQTFAAPESLSALCACEPATTKRQCSIFERSLQEKNGLVMESPGPVLPVKVAKASEPEEEAELRLAAMVCSLENKDECLMCGS